MALFFQPDNLPAVEWDGDKQRPKFQFKRRFLRTTDKRLARYLADKGYELQQEDGATTRNVQGASLAGQDETIVPAQRKDARVKR